MLKNILVTVGLLALVIGFLYLSSPVDEVKADVVCVGSNCPQPTSTPAPTATAAPTFPSTGSFGVVVPYYTYTDNGNSGASKTINWATGGPKQKITTTASCTITFTAPTNGVANLTLVIVHENSASSYTYTWPAAVKWPSGAAISTTNTANAVDIMTCFYDSTNYYCVPSTNFS